MACLIETAKATFLRAKVGLSVVPAGRYNKNRINIDRYNKIMYTICHETERSNMDLYKDGTQPNCKGV